MDLGIAFAARRPQPGQIAIVEGGPPRHLSDWYCEINAVAGLFATWALKPGRPFGVAGMFNRYEMATLYWSCQGSA